VPRPQSSQSQDRDLAKLYVTNAALNQAVRRNSDRYPEDFMFQLTAEEMTQLNRSQIVIGSENIATLVFDHMFLPNRAVAMLFECICEANVRSR
jgi:hypothetical protein